MGTLATFLPYILLFVLIVMMFTCLKGKGMGGCCGTTVHSKDSSENQKNSENSSSTISTFQSIHLSELQAQMEVLEEQNRILMTEIETLKKKQKESSA